MFVIVAMSNAVNLTDGLDGLAGSTSAVAFAAYGIIANLQGQYPLMSFCFAMVGALFAFLWYNSHPAQLFMGDTGALALGATLAVVALMTGQWLLLPVVGLVFVAEAASDVLQVSYFKWTKRRTGAGKRIFKMAPLHHHFELLGWSETHIVWRFFLISILAGHDRRRAGAAVAALARCVRGDIMTDAHDWQKRTRQCSSPLDAQIDAALAAGDVESAMAIGVRRSEPRLWLWWRAIERGGDGARNGQGPWGGASS